MPAQPKNLFVRLVSCLYRGLLHAYPQEFRSRYGDEMTQAFRDNLRDTLSNEGSLGLVRFCMRARPGISSPAFRAEIYLGKCPRNTLRGRGSRLLNLCGIC